MIFSKHYRMEGLQSLTEKRLQNVKMTPVLQSGKKLGYFGTKKALQNSCELLRQQERQRKELHTSSWNCIQGHETACKLMELHVSSWNSMQAQGTACKLMELHVSSWNCMLAHGNKKKQKKAKINLEWLFCFDWETGTAFCNFPSGTLSLSTHYRQV